MSPSSKPVVAFVLVFCTVAYAQGIEDERAAAERAFAEYVVGVNNGDFALAKSHAWGQLTDYDCLRAFVEFAKARYDLTGAMFRRLGEKDPTGEPLTAKDVQEGIAADALIIRGDQATLQYGSDVVLLVRVEGVWKVDLTGERLTEERRRRHEALTEMMRGLIRDIESGRINDWDALEKERTQREAQVWIRLRAAATRPATQPRPPRRETPHD